MPRTPIRPLPRRQFIQLLGSGAASVYLGGCFKLPWSQGERPASSLTPAAQAFLKNFGPIDRSRDAVAAASSFGGDDPTVPHHVLWKKKDFIAALPGGKLPPVSEEVPVLIVGGGMSGLLTAYQLRDLKPLVLEQGARLGGNSRGESWDGIDYSLATAYFVAPEAGSQIESFFKEVGIGGPGAKHPYRTKNDTDPLSIDGKLYANYWEEGTLPETKSQFTRLAKHFTDVLKETDGQRFPNIPPRGPEETAYVHGLDQMSFRQYIEKFLGEPLHPHVDAVFERYFWSSAAASFGEFSAAAGLNFFSGDFDSVAVMSGGNAGILEALLPPLLASTGADHLRPSALVFNVNAQPDFVDVTYLGPDNQARTVRAKTVVMSCPKFVARHLIDDLEPARVKDIQTIQYRAYLVANVLLNQAVKDSFYDFYFFKDPGKTPKKSGLKNQALAQQATDFVYGNFAKPHASRTVLTVFRGFPYEGVRQDLYAQDAFSRFSKEFEKQIHAEVLPLVGAKPENVVGTRLARWGHPLPLSAVGHLASGRAERIRAPFKKRVLFAEQDNYVLPCFEMAFHEAQVAATDVRKLL